MDQAKIGRFIAEMRKEQGLTQREFAELLGISDKSVECRIYLLCYQFAIF